MAPLFGYSGLLLFLLGAAAMMCPGFFWSMRTCRRFDPPEPQREAPEAHEIEAIKNRGRWIAAVGLVLAAGGILMAGI
ncbi:MAG: hypothetical protein ACLFVU_11140 [Phycisphaerae bacterium]